MKVICAVHQLGIIDYEKAWQLQDQLAGEIAAGLRPPTLLLLEHPHTYTFGRRGHLENLLWDEAELAHRGVSVHWVDRGGDVTYHGPGQMVGYPLLPLNAGGLRIDPTSGSPRLPQADYVGYIRNLEEALILALANLGLASGQIKGLTGVWVQPDVLSRCKNCPPDQKQPPAKIAAIGVKVDVKGVSRHGFALNVNPDMTYWQGIIGCGLSNYPVTSLAELIEPAPSMEQVSRAIIKAFGEVFEYEMASEDLIPTK
jgi:lipoyl(octanoyl) transferase